jgi:hypothetical protein
VAADLTSSLETYVQTIVDAAHNKAAEIEREAEQAAMQKEQDSERRAQEILDAVVSRTSHLLGSIELVESSLRGMIGGLRAELETLTNDLAEQSPDVIESSSIAPPVKAPATEEKAPAAEEISHSSEEKAPSVEERAAPNEAESSFGPVAAGLEDDIAFAQPLSQEEQDAPAAPATDAARAVEPDQVPPAPLDMPFRSGSQADVPADAAAEFDQMIHAKIKEMIDAGKPRKEVERFLKRFKRGKQYIDQLDGMYAERAPSSPPRKGGAFSRLWRRR